MTSVTDSAHLQIKTLLILFFISGFSALCYQIVWQRILFATFGINIESVTIIVSLFMFGLGIGALVGGWLQKYSGYLLHLFIVFEIAIGLFGLTSPTLISRLGEIPDLRSLLAITLCVYAVFAVPTLLMGATLPVLVGHINRYLGHTGTSVCWLYAANTAGAVAASILTVTFLFTHFGLHAVIVLAACVNFITAGSAFFLYRKASAGAAVPHDVKTCLPPSAEIVALSAWLILFLGLTVGYITLSQELIWFRILGYVAENNPRVFGLLLGSILTGIALSSIQSGTAMISGRRPQDYVVSALLKVSAVWFLSFPLTGFVASHTIPGVIGKSFALTTGLFMAGFTAYFSGGVFPLLCNMLQEKTKRSAGQAVGMLYFANVMGATLGPLLTGFVIFEYVSFPSTVLINGLMTLAVVLLVAIFGGPSGEKKGKTLLTVAAVTALGFGLHVFAYDRFLEKLQFAQPSPAAFDALDYNRSGFISVTGGRVYGNGAYDGSMTIDPSNNDNGITRFYALPAFHPNPLRVLDIGLSGGSETKILSLYKPLRQVVAIEINKGYLNIIQKYPDHADILKNPKVKLVVDDGRRWLHNHPDEKFDVITANVIYHWRSNATNMLSREFMELCKKHLNPGGYIYINSTGAEDVAYTAAHVFDYVSVPFGYMVLAGDTPSGTDRATRLANLEKYTYPNGQAVFADRAVLDKLADVTYPDMRDALLRRTDLQVITDDNMATEFKHPHVVPYMKSAASKK